LKKQAYFDKLINLLETEKHCLIISVDNVGSKQLQRIRIKCRDKATILMGKNTMIRTALRMRIKETEDEGLERLLQVIRGNIGFIFCKPGKVEEVREVLETEKISAGAKVGILAPDSVTLPAGPCGLDPAQTSFFQALNIATKIVKGQIEIVSEVNLINSGDRVGASACALLTKLGIKPFMYGVKLEMLYEDGCVFDARVLDITDDDLVAKFMHGVMNVAAFGREIGIPTEAGLPHMVMNAFKNIAALVCDLDYSFPEVEIVKEYLADPSKFASAAAAPSGGGGGAAPTAAAVAAPVEEEEEEELDFDLFG